MKKDGLKIVLSLGLTALVLISGLSLFNAPKAVATNGCTPVDKYITKDSDSTSTEVNFDFQNDDKKVVISADSGYTITEVWLNINGDGIGFIKYGTSAGTYDPSGNSTISEAKVRVIKTCPTATPTPQSVKVDICHKAGQSGNYTHNSVSVHSVNDANGLNGHGDHDHDIWAPFTFNGVNYPGNGNYNGFNLITCVANSTPTATPVPTSTPTQTPVQTPSPTATPTGTSQPTYSPTATPTATPSDDPTSTPTSSSEPTATPNGDICANLDGIQTSMPDEYHHDNAGVNCLKFELGGPPPPSDSGIGGGQVLGASTMAGTGATENAIFNSLFTLGSLLTSFGIMKNGKKKA